MNSWLDGFLADASQWVARNTSPHGVLAKTSRVAGVSPVVPLPLDRRDSIDDGTPRRGTPRRRTPPRQPQGAAAATDDRMWGLAAMAAPHKEQSAPSCSDPQYCHLHGNACACCGGTDASCPGGTEIGHYWSFCCSGRTIYFTDCCGRGATCNSAACPWCDNSSQPNWCGGAGGNKYVCTMAEDKGSC